MRFKYWMLILLVAFIAACGTTTNLFTPTESDLSKLKTEYPEATAADLQQGFTLYKLNCGGCHTLHLPTDKNKEQWAKLLPEMFGKTKLKAEEERLITQYLYAKAK
jgi:cytochrome c5